MAITTGSSKSVTSYSQKQHGNEERHRSLPPLPISPCHSSTSRRRHTPTSSSLSSPGTSHTPSRIPTPMTSSDGSSSPPVKPGPKTSSSRLSNTRTSTTKGPRSLPSGKVKRDNDMLDRMIEENCTPLRKDLAKVTQDLARVTQDLLGIKSQVAALEANHKKKQKGDFQSESTAEPQTARQKEKAPQKEFQPLTYASTSEATQAEGSTVRETRNDMQETSSDVQYTIMKLRDEIEKLRNKNRELEERLRAHRPENVELINAEEGATAGAENEKFQPSAQQCETNPMDLDQEASGPSNSRGSGQNGESSSQQEEILPQQVSFEMIQRLSQEQDPYENVPDPDDMVTEVHTNQQSSEVQAQNTVTGNDPLIEAGFMHHGPIITQQDIPPAPSYRGPSAPAQDTADERSHEVSRLCETAIVRVHPQSARRRHHRDIGIQEERVSQTRGRHRRRYHRSSHEERYPDDPRRSQRYHRRHRCRSKWERRRNDRIITRYQRVDGDRRIPLIVRVCPSVGRMFFPDEYGRR